MLFSYCLIKAAVVIASVRFSWIYGYIPTSCYWLRPCSVRFSPVSRSRRWPDIINCLLEAHCSHRNSSSKHYPPSYQFLEGFQKSRSPSTSSFPSSCISSQGCQPSTWTRPTQSMRRNEYTLYTFTWSLLLRRQPQSAHHLTARQRS